MGHFDPQVTCNVIVFYFGLVFFSTISSIVNAMYKVGIPLFLLQTKIFFMKFWNWNILFFFLYNIIFSNAHSFVIIFIQICIAKIVFIFIHHTVTYLILIEIKILIQYLLSLKEMNSLTIFYTFLGMGSDRPPRNYEH